MNGLQELIKETVLERTEELPATPVPWAALHRRRRRHSLQVGGTVAAVAVACGGVFATSQLLSAGGSGPGPATVAPAAITHPIKVSGLLGPWTVSVAGGKQDKVQVTDGQASLQGECGELGAVWVATADGQFRAAFSYGSGCDDGVTLPKAVPAWLGEATRVRPTAEGWALLGADGEVTATLTPDPAATMLTNDPAAVARLDRELPPLPAGKRPVTAAELVGSWVPEAVKAAGHDGVPGHTVVTFAARSGAEGRGVTWLLDPLGHVAIPHAGPTTMICAGIPGEPGCADVPSWFDDTRVTLEQGRLVLYDASGKAVHTLVRS